MMRIRAAARTHVGNRRSSNEDAFLLDGRVVADALDQRAVCDFDARAPFLCAVADGMGGAPAGEVASRIVLECLRDCLPADEPALLAALEAANGALYTAMTAQPQWRGMGATVAGFLVGDNELCVFGVGDCFAGRIGGRAVRPLLRSFDEVGASSVVDSALGAALSRMPLRIERTSVHAPTGRYILATDGIIAGCSIDVLRSTLLGPSHTAEHIVDMLTGRIIAGPAPDNLTCIVLEVSAA